MTKYGEMIDLRIINPATRYVCGVTFMPQPLYPRTKIPSVSIDEGAGRIPEQVCTPKTNSPVSVGHQQLLGGPACSLSATGILIALTVYKGYELRARRSTTS
jgi:hypothetical protein